MTWPKIWFDIIGDFLGQFNLESPVHWSSLEINCLCFAVYYSKSNDEETWNISGFSPCIKVKVLIFEFLVSFYCYFIEVVYTYYVTSIHWLVILNVISYHWALFISWGHEIIILFKWNFNISRIYFNFILLLRIISLNCFFSTYFDWEILWNFEVCNWLLHKEFFFIKAFGLGDG